MRNASFTIRRLTEADYPQVVEIYEHGLDTGHATFERHAPSWEKFQHVKIMETAHVAVDDNGKVLGWVTAAPASQRDVFFGVVEDSIYIHPDARGMGVAGALLDTLIEVCIKLEKWAIHSWIFPENEGSAKLHQSRGFEKAGTLSHVAKMPYGELKGQWRDTDIWEKLLPKPDLDVSEL